MLQLFKDPQLKTRLYLSVAELKENERLAIEHSAQIFKLTVIQQNQPTQIQPSYMSFTLDSNEHGMKSSIQLLSFLSQIKTLLNELPACVLLATRIHDPLALEQELDSSDLIERLLKLLDPEELLCERALYPQHQDFLLDMGLIRSSERFRVHTLEEGQTLSLQWIALQLDEKLDLTQWQGETWSVGRYTERTLVIERLRAVARREKLERPLLVIQAEPGMGKSSFLKSLYPHIKAEGLDVAYTLCLDFISGEIAGTLSTLARSLMNLISAQEATEPITRARLSAWQDQGLLPSFDQDFIYPELFNVALNAEEQSALSHYTSQRLWRLRYEGLGYLIDQCLQKRPLCLIFEDLHWMDEEGLGLLQSLLNSDHIRRGFMILCTSRESNPLHKKALFTEYLEWIELPLLSLMESRELAQRITRQRRLPWQLQQNDFVSSDWLERCIVQAEGHPLYLIQLLSQSPQNTIKDNLDLKALLMTRYRELSTGARQLLAIASCVGRIFSLDQLPKSLEFDQKNLLYELFNSHLILKQGIQIEFCHALLRDAIYEELTEELRRSYHLAIAEMYHDHLELYAEHLALAEDPRACEAFIEAAQQKVTAVKLQAALSLYERALRIPLSTKEKIDVLCRQGWLYEQLGDGKRCLRCFEEALAQTDLGLHRPPPNILLGILAAQRLLGELQQAEQSILVLQKQLQGRILALPIFKARFAYYRGSIAFSKGALEACSKAHQEATQVIETLGTLDDREAMNVYAQAWSGRGDAAYAQGRFVQAHHAMTQAVDIARDVRLGRVEVSTLHMLAIVTTYLGLPHEGIELARRCYRQATRVNDLRATLFSELNVALPMLWAGQSLEAQSYAQSALQRAQWMESPVLIGMSSAFVSFSAWSAGQFKQAHSLGEEALKLSAHAGERLYGGVALGAVLLNAELDDVRIKDWFKAGLDLLKSKVVSHNYIYFTLGAAPMMVLLKERQLLEELSTILSDFFGSEYQPISSNETLNYPVPYCLIQWLKDLSTTLSGTCLNTSSQQWSAHGLKLFEQISELRILAHSEEISWCSKVLEP